MKRFAGIAAFALVIALASPALAEEPVATPAATPPATPTDAPTGSPTPSPSATPGPTAKPSAVTNLSLVEASVPQMVISWDAPADAASSFVTDYRVDYKFDDFGGLMTYRDGVSDLTDATLEDLPLDVWLTVTVRAVNALGTSKPTRIRFKTPRPGEDLLQGLSNGQAPNASKVSRFISRYWNSHVNSKYGYYPHVNCANWASQSLVLRGFKTSAKWHPRQSRTIPASMAWISSTRLRNYLVEREGVVELTDAQRDQVKVGDLVQFDWWNKGAKEHTGIVSHIQQTATGLKIYYASHTAHGEFWSVDRSIKVSYPGATVTYLSIPKR